MVKIDMDRRMNTTNNHFIKLYLSVKLRSIEEDEEGSIWIGSDINRSKSYIKIKELIWVPSGEMTSSTTNQQILLRNHLKIIVNDALSLAF